MTTLINPPLTSRLLTGIDGTNRAVDLESHVALHGPFPVPPRRDDSWSEGFIDMVAASGLIGRGGAGFPTAEKLRWIRTQRRRPVVAVNAMEGEPASHKDEALASLVPHLVLDGASAVARCIDARAISVCVPDRSDRAALSFEHAIREREGWGIDPVPIAVLRPPGRFITGEESALTGWLDGGDPLPRFRSDRPSILGVGGRPCLVDNAETLAHLALIVRHGAESFRTAGTPDAPGTTLITISGAVGRSGVYEVPFGLPISSILAMAGAPNRPAGVLLGGFGGTWLSPGRLDTLFEPVSLRVHGASVGAGALVVLPPQSCGLLETARIASWMASESAGQCGPCAFGLPAVADDTSLLASGRANAGDLRRLEARLNSVDGRGACRHPDGVVRMVRSALSTFGQDVDRHLRAGPCAGARMSSVMQLTRY